jgi:hypothetical protein
VGPATFAGNDIEDAVTIDVGELDSVDLAETRAGGVVFLRLAEDDVFLERAVGVLFEPG